MRIFKGFTEILRITGTSLQRAGARDDIIVSSGWCNRQLRCPQQAELCTWAAWGAVLRTLEQERLSIPERSAFTLEHLHVHPRNQHADPGSTSKEPTCWPGESPPRLFIAAQIVTAKKKEKKKRGTYICCLWSRWGRPNTVIQCDTLQQVSTAHWNQCADSKRRKLSMK